MLLLPAAAVAAVLLAVTAVPSAAPASLGFASTAVAVTFFIVEALALPESRMYCEPSANASNSHPGGQHIRYRQPGKRLSARGRQSGRRYHNAVGVHMDTENDRLIGIIKSRIGCRGGAVGQVSLLSSGHKMVISHASVVMISARLSSRLRIKEEIFKIKLKKNNIE